MSTYVLQVEKKNLDLDTIFRVSEKIMEYSPEASPMEIDQSVMAILTFGGSIQFDIPLGSCVLKDNDSSIIVEIQISEHPYPIEVFKVASVKNENGQILLLVSTTSDEPLFKKKKYKILSTYGNTENLTNTELGKLWIIHEMYDNKHIYTFSRYEDAKTQFDSMKENLMRIRVYQEIRNQFLNPIIQGMEDM